MISLFQPASFLGLYNKAESLRSMPITIISGSIYQVSFRALSKFQEDIPEAQKLYLRTLKLGLLYVTPIYIFLFFAAKPLVGFIYGPKWLPAADALAVLALVGPLMIIGNQSGAVIEAFNRLKNELILQIWILVLIIVSQYIILKHAPSLHNVAITMAGIAIINVARMVYLTKQALDLTWIAFYKAVTPVTVTNAILFTLCYGIDRVISPLKTGHPLLYLMTFSATLFCTYALLVAILPYKENNEELKRWIHKLIKLSTSKP
jgi:O-antigen/teichoic acid export membrane protein